MAKSSTRIDSDTDADTEPPTVVVWRPGSDAMRILHRDLAASIAAKYENPDGPRESTADQQMRSRL